MSLKDLPAVVRQVAPLVVRRPAVTGRVISRAPAVRTLPNTRTPITVQGVAREIKKVKPNSTFGLKQIVIGGAAISATILVDRATNELIDYFSGATPEELQTIMAEADKSGEPAVADAIGELYNDYVMMNGVDYTEGGSMSDSEGSVNYSDRDEFAYSTADKDMIATDTIERSGLGISIGEVNRMQVLSRMYRSIRSTFTYEDLFALRLLVTTASDEDLSALEDIYNGN